MRGGKETLGIVGVGGSGGIFGPSSNGITGSLLVNGPGGGSTNVGPSSGSSDRIKKASYYVWFLGACECRGLRGSDVVSAVLGKLLGRERDQEPEKVTLQVSSKGIKLLQLLQDGAGSGGGGLGGSGGLGGGGGGGGRAAKHLLPAAALTYVQQEAPPDDDLVTAILLIYNPVTRCPVHVHAYRCDSSETASMLKDHLSLLLHRPQQQAKLAALEARLAGRGLLHRSRQPDGTMGSPGGSGGSCGGGNNGGASVAALYDSLAAELREKLGGASSAPGPPLLLPPRDYHRQEDDSARSSGIGSDDAPPSPIMETLHSHARPALNRQPSSSDEEWAGHDPTDYRAESTGLLIGQQNSATAWKNSSPNGYSSGYQNGRSNHRTRSPSPLTRNSSRPQLKADRESYREQYKDSFRESPQKESFREPQRESFRDSHKESFRDSHKGSFRDLQKESFRDSHKDLYRDSYRGGDREDRYASKDCYRSSSRLAARRMVSPSRNLSPIRIGPQRKVPPAMKHSPLHHNNRDRSESPVSPRERFQDAREKFLSLEKEWRSGGALRASASAAMVEQAPVVRRSKGGSGHRSSRRENREELVWPKTDRDTGYGSRDGLLRGEKRATRDYDRGYGTCDTRDSDHWKRELERRSPDFWDSKGPERSLSPNQDNRNYRMPRARSPERTEQSQRNEYQRAKSMHDLSRHRSMQEDDMKGDFRRRSLYDTLDSPHLQKSRSQQHQNQHYHSYGNLGPVRSCSPSSSSSGQSIQGYELPDSQRYPGLDRSSARPDPLLTPRYAGFNKKTFDYPVNGGHAPIHISRAQHDDYRRFRYDHNPPQFARSSSIPTAQY